MAKRGRHKALTPEARENQLVQAAVDLAEKQLLDGTASPSVITHFLRLGSTKNELEKEKIAHENELLKAKTEAIYNAQHVEELYNNAIAAMRIYSGSDAQND